MLNESQANQAVMILQLANQKISWRTGHILAIPSVQPKASLQTGWILLVTKELSLIPEWAGWAAVLEREAMTTPILVRLYVPVHKRLPGQMSHTFNN